MEQRRTIRHHHLNAFASLFRELYHDESGAAATEYVIVTCLLAVVLIPLSGALANAARLWFWKKAITIAGN